MKKISIIYLLLILSINLFCQDSYFILKNHPLDINKAADEINKICNDGYLPIGLDIIEGKNVRIAYTKNSNLLKFKNWNLRQDIDLENINQIYSAFLKKSWLPMGFSRSKKANYVLFLKTNAKINSWKILSSDCDLKTMESVIISAVAEGFIPTGMTYIDKRCHYFFVKSDVFLIKKIAVRKYAASNFEKILKQDLDAGFTPWAFMPVVNDFYILYVK